MLLLPPHPAAVGFPFFRGIRGSLGSVCRPSVREFLQVTFHHHPGICIRIELIQAGESLQQLGIDLLGAQAYATPAEESPMKYDRDATD